MTCRCPVRWCYQRSDCRHLKPIPPLPMPAAPLHTRLGNAQAYEAEARKGMLAESALWLTERHEALLAELEEEHWTLAQRRAKEHALVLIHAAIERRLT